MAVIGAVGVAAMVLVAALVVGRRGTIDVPPGSPQATVQAYLQAISDRDRSGARAQLTDWLASNCSLVDIGLPTVERAVLVRTTTTGDRARVVVSVTERWSSGLLDLQDTTSLQTFNLERTPSGWRIRDLPWPVFACSPKAPPVTRPCHQ